MPKPKHPHFTGTATSERQEENDVRAGLFQPEGNILRYVPKLRVLSKAERRWQIMRDLRGQVRKALA